MIDGSSLYRYDQASRLISTTLSVTTTLFNYNGDGIRLKQIIARVPTTYTQDYAAPLPVVLQSKTDATTTQFAYDADGAWHANATRLQFTTLLGC